jgi:hypothetical protein
MAGLIDDKYGEKKQDSSAYASDPLADTPERDPEKRDERKRKSESRSLLKKTKSAQRIRGRGVINDDYSSHDTLGDYSSPIDGIDSDYSDSYANVPTNEWAYRDDAVSEVTGSLTQPEDEEGWGVKTLDFLFGAEGAIIGINHDADGWAWNMENMKDQWAEQPLWSNLLSTASLIGTIALPAGLAVKSSMKMGMLAGKAGRAAFETAEVTKWAELNIMDDAIKGIATHESMGPATVKRMRILAASKEKQIKRLGRKDMARATEAGEDVGMTAMDKVKYAFEKRFANTYNDIVNDTGGLVASPKQRFAASLDAALGEGAVGKMLDTMPVDEKQFIPISAYLMSKLSPEVAAKSAKHLKKLTPESKQWADFFMESSIIKQKSRLDDGFIDQETFDRIGRFHMAGVDKGTEGLDGARSILVPVRGPVKTEVRGLVEVEKKGLLGGKKTVIEAADEVSYVPISVQARPRLSGPTLMHRASTHEELFERMVQGRVISDPADVLSKGYLTDEILHTNFKTVRDIAMDPKLATNAAAIEAFGFKKAKKLGFRSLEAEGILGAGGAKTLRRMIAKQTGNKEEALPWIREEIFEDIFGVNGMFDQTSHVAANMMDVATTIYKTAKTAGNIPTHLQNLTGNLTFLAQAGFNPLDPQNIALMTGLHKSFTKLAEISAISHKAETAGKGAREAFDAAGAIKKINFGTIKYKGVTLDLNKELTDPIIKELIEDSAFSSAEGAGMLGNIAQSLTTDQHATKALIKGINAGRKFVQGGDRVKWWEGMTRAYLEEDMLPKMAYYLSLRADGFSKVGAATEVARRLPMYNTVGSTIKKGRKFWMPWATFPAEAARITKNNIQDYPLRMMPWLRAPQILQATASGMGIAPDTREGVEEAEKMLPWWAQKSTTVVAEGGAVAKIGGATTGAVAGAWAGGLMGGAKGVVMGAAGGAVVGGVAAAMATDEEHEKHLRGSLMDWLPHSTTFLATTSKDWAGEGIIPARTFQGMIEQMPAEPLAILKPMLDAMNGEDAFGNPVGDGTAFNGTMKALAGTIGLLAPPIVQKYGFQTRLPDVPVPIDPLGITNIARLKVEGGSIIPFMDPAMDPMTGMVGSLGHDFFLNNFGTFKSYMATAETQLANETITERHMGDVRNKLTKNLTFHLENGNDKEVVGLLSEVQSTFSKQFAADPRQAQMKYTEWLERRKTQIGRHPRLRNWSEEELTARLRQAGHAAGEARSEARNHMLQALRDEMKVRGMGAGSSGLGSGVSGSGVGEGDGGLSESGLSSGLLG